MATNPPVETFTAEQFLAVANGQQIQTETAIAMLRYAATLARENERLRADIRGGALVQLKEHPEDDCPSWYDGCNCTVENLRHNIERAETAEREVETLKAALAKALESGKSGNNILDWVSRSSQQLTGQAGVLSLLTALVFAVVAGGVPVRGNEVGNTVVHERIPPDVRLAEDVVVFNAPNNGDKQLSSRKAAILLGRHAEDLVLSNELISGLNNVGRIFPVKCHRRLSDLRQEQGVIGGTSNHRGGTPSVCQFIFDANLTVRQPINFPVLNCKPRPFERPSRLRRQFVNIGAVSGGIGGANRGEQTDQGDSGRYERQYGKRARKVSDVFLRRDIPLLSIFLALGCFGAWLGGRDRNADRWLGGACIAAGTVGIGAVAGGWL